MKRTWAWMVIALAGCSNSSSSSIDVGRIKQLSVTIETSRGEPVGYYLGVRFDVQPPPPDLAVRATCQVENQPHVDVGPAVLEPGARPGDMPPSVPFIINPLAKRPEQCELTFFQESTPGTPLGVACARTGTSPVVVTPGACP